MVNHASKFVPGTDNWPVLGLEPILEAAEEELAHFDCHAVVIRGPAGIGKTTILRRLIEDAGTAGHETELIVGTVGAGTIDFGPMLHLLPDPGIDASQADLLWRAVDRFEQNHAESGVRLGIDDAQSLDDASAAWVQRVVHAGFADVVITIRRGETLPAPVAALVSDPSVAVYNLEALTAETAREIVETALHGTVDDKTFKEIWTLSGGNPMLLRLLVEGGRPHPDDRYAPPGTPEVSWHVDAALAQRGRLTSVVGRHLETLAQDDRDALEVVAFGQPLDLGVAETIAGADILESLDSRDLLFVERAGIRTLVYSGHPVYAQVLRRNVGELRKRRILNQLADALSETGMKRFDDQVRVAVWRLDAGSHLASEALLDAAAQALSLFDQRTAERLARAAITEGAGLRGEIVLAQALASENRVDEAETAFREARSRAADADELIDAAVAHSFCLTWQCHRPQDALSVHDEVDAQMAESGSGRSPLLDAARASALFSLDRTDEALAQADSVLAIGDIAPAAELSALNTSAVASALMGHSRRALEDAERGSALVSSLLGDHSGKIAVFAMPSAQFLSNLNLGEFPRALGIAERAFEFADSVSGRVLVAAWRTLASDVMMTLGRPQTALRLADQACEILRETDVFGHLPLALAFRAKAAALGGELDAARRDAAEVAVIPTESSASLGVAVEPALAWVSAIDGNTELAARQLLAIAEAAQESGYLFLAVRAYHDAARVGGAAQAAEHLPGLAARVDGDFVEIVADHARGVATADAGELARVAGLFADLEANVVAAECASLAAQAASRRDDKTAATRLERLRGDLLGRCEQVSTPALARSSVRATEPELTARESEVAVLAARDLASREIAERLGVSVRTVDNHLGRIYAKLGIDGRSGLQELFG